MARVAVTAAALKRIANLELQRRQVRPRTGVLMVPPILAPDEWEAQAMASQAALAQATREGVDMPPMSDAGAPAC